MQTKIERYVRQLQLQLSEQINDKSKVYLDLRFWILLRDAAHTEIQNKQVRLLEVLQLGIDRERIICPISESSYWELMKQANTPTRRHATAALIDRLSVGVSLIPSERRMSTEIARFFFKYGTDFEVEDADSLVWTKLSYSLGDFYPTFPRLDADHEFLAQKEIVDLLWSNSMKELTERSAAQADFSLKELEEIASRHDSEIKAHSQNLRSYRQAYLDEIDGVLDVMSEEIAVIMVDLAHRLGQPTPPAGSEEWLAAGRIAKNFLAGAFRKEDIASHLPTIHATASLHAGIRWDLQSRFKANHFFDLEHAAAALVYCDAFLTEGHLTALCTNGATKLSQFHKCNVTSDIDEAISIVEALLK